EPTPVQIYQLANHISSASLELDQNGGLISYEEYHPYGTTAFQAMAGAAEVSLKRYRYTGKERDEETGLSYHGARYCATWLGRWTAADPIGIADGLNVFAYVNDNPIVMHDPRGTDGVKLNNFERQWVQAVAMPILETTQFKSSTGNVSIAMDKRILMVAHSRGESLGQWRNDDGDFERQKSLNLFNLQGMAGTAGSEK